jgi:nucleotide-binding universal stress UspA family protein
MYQKILVPVDGSETSMVGLKEAVKLAKSQGSQLRLVHVVNELILDYSYGASLSGTDVIECLREGGRKIIRWAEALAREQGVQSDGVLLESIGGAAADSILAHAKEWPADLIVMGTHGRRGLQSFFAMGSDAESVVRSASVPVLLVHDVAKELRSPGVATVTTKAASAGTREPPVSTPLF